MTALFKKNPNKIKLCREDRIMYTIVDIVMVLFMIIIIYPLIYVVSCSFSGGAAVASGRVLFLPVEFSTMGYKLVFSYRRVWTGYANTILYTVMCTVVHVIMTTMVAYPMSRRQFQGKKIYLTAFLFTMWFSGGLIPSYILMCNLHLVGTRWAMLLNGSTMSVYHMIIMRTYFRTSIPYELFEAAKMDGISDIKYLLKIVVPLSKAIFAVITLYVVVGTWNSYFGAMLYLRDRDMYPLQLVLRDILNVSEIDLTQITDPDLIKQLSNVNQSMNYALIVVSSLPMMVMYPFVQKFFEKGIMIGSVKG